MPRGKFKIILTAETVDELRSAVKVEKVIDVTPQPEPEDEEDNGDGQ